MITQLKNSIIISRQAISKDGVVILPLAEYQKIKGVREKLERQKKLSIEESGGKLTAFEFKWKGKAKTPTEFLKSYPNSEFTTITVNNYFNFVL
ncbi:MAG: hypothetical protein V1649_00640 [Patescibacteria group bacterium]